MKRSLIRACKSNFNKIKNGKILHSIKIEMQPNRFRTFEEKYQENICKIQFIFLSIEYTLYYDVDLFPSLGMVIVHFVSEFRVKA